MSSFDFLLSHARRYCLRISPTIHQTLGLQTLLRPFCSTAVPIKPVSYPVKPKDNADESSESSSSAHEVPTPPYSPPPPRRRWPEPRAQEASADAESAGSRPWTREEVRFLKDTPVITPVSYRMRVAPLPEDRPAASKEEEELKEKREDEPELRRVAERIQLQSEARVRSLFAAQEVETVPFPTLIVPEKKPPKAPMDLLDAIRQVKASAKRNFIETVEAHVNLGVDPRRSDQMVRGALTLPHGTGKTVRIAVFSEGVAAEEARAAGADVVGGDELIEEIKNGGGKLNFDKCIATPSFMLRLSKIARILGPRGLMPNTKLGSVTNDISAAVKEAKCGRIDFKIDKTAIVHVGLGKVTFSEESLRENIGAFVHALLVAKPVGLKKTSKYAGYVKNFTLCSTMGPGFPVSVQSLSLAADHYNKINVK